MKVRLIGRDEAVHASGEMRDEVMENMSLIIRNERYYRYLGMRDRGVAVFVETDQPFRLTEF